MITKENLGEKFGFLKKINFSFANLKNNKKSGVKKENQKTNFFEIKKIFGKNKKNLKITTKQKIYFFDNLYNLLDSGIPFVNSLKLMHYQAKDKNMEFMLKIILDEIKTGKKFSEILSFFPKIFKNFDLALVEVGEQTGNLPRALDIIKTREEKAKDLRGKIIGALIYPTIIVILAIAMVITFLVYVIPKIHKMYIEARVSLPVLTKKVIEISQFLQNNIIFIVAGFFLFIFMIILLKKNKKTKYFFDKTILKIPLFGNLIRKKILIVFSQTLGTLLSSGVLINKALEITKKSLENEAYSRELDKMIIGVSQGKPLSDFMGIELLSQKKESFYFPMELASATKIGEQTGNTEKLLLSISKKFKKELDIITKNIGTAIEPVVIIFVGLVIGTIIMAILLPFFNMVNVVG